MMELTDLQKQLEEQYLTSCIMYRGEYLSASHGSGSWATTYSNQFIIAAAQLLMLYKSAGSCSPEYELSRVFKKRGIRSCRGSEMTITRVKYLLNTHLKATMLELNKL